MDKALSLDPSNRVHIDLHCLVQCQPDKHTSVKEKRQYFTTKFIWPLHLQEMLKVVSTGFQDIHESNTICWENIRLQDTVLTEFNQASKELSRFVEVLKEVQKFCG